MKFDIKIPTCREGIFVPAPFAGPEEIVKIVTTAEKLGLHAVWGTDFLTPTPFRGIPETETPNWYEVLISLAYLAALTNRIKLGAGVIMLPFRDVVILAKQAATLDQFSGGRFLLGIGLGTNREEFEAIKPRERKVHRGRLMDEQLEALRLLLDHNTAKVSFKGDYIEFSNVELHPKPVRAPFPIYVSGKNVEALRRVAQFGTGLMIPASKSAEGIDALSAMLEKHKREISEIEICAEAQQRLAKSHEAAENEFFGSRLGYRRKNADTEAFVADNWIGTPTEVAEKIHKVAQYGIDHFISLHIAADTVDDMLEQMQMFAEEVIPLVA